ncbi:MAG: YfcE family phosphodiesterase [Myxococcaceae bacterium]
MRPSRYRAALFCLLAACQPGSAEDAVAARKQAIVGGVVDTQDAAVVKLNFRGKPECSGSLIGPWTVLTAAHCSVPAGTTSLLSVQIEPGGGAAPLSREVVAQHFHPQWDPRVGAHDLVLLQLNDAVQLVKPLLLYPRPLTVEDVGREVRVVGYGATEGGSPTGIGTRREVTLSIRQLLRFEIEAGATGKQACAGDSGGPALMRIREEGPEYLAATVSDGDRSCQTTGFYARVDIDAEWIASTASAWDSVASCSPPDPDCPGAVDPGIGEPPPSGSCDCAAPGGLLGLLSVLALRKTKAATISSVKRSATFPLRDDGTLRLVAVADTHSKLEPAMAKRIAARLPDAILHAGDIGEGEVLDRLGEVAPVFAVRGNVDGRAIALPDVLTLELAGAGRSLRLLLVHIGVYGPKLRANVARMARAEGASLVVCGHSHVPFIGQDRGLTVFNPGSIGPRRFHLPVVFGTIEVTPAGLRLAHVDAETGRAWTPP